MTQSQGNPTVGTGKGKAFFDRADQVAETGNWDFAIELYLEGISREPGNLERGHKPLREVALKRKLQGGKGPGMIEQLKRGASKKPEVSLTNAEYLLAKEPGSSSFMVRVLQAVQKLELIEVVRWICDILLEAQRQQAKPNKQVLLVLTDAFQEIEEYASAMQSLEMARQISPNDPRFGPAMQELSAKYTIKKGRYSESEDFTQGVKDMDKQQELMQKDSLVKGKGYLEQQLEAARKEYLDSPTVAGKIAGYVDALLKFEDPGYENEAIDVLAKAHKDTGAYQFKMRIGEIKIRQMTRRYRKLLEGGDKAGAQQAMRDQLKFELAEYAERVANYPTDLSLTYELGRRQLMAGQLDEAIASLQKARRDPRRHVKAMDYLGQAFEKKGWHREAAETFEAVLETELTEEMAKEIRYNLGNAYEQMNDLDKAQEQFSEVAQIDYNFKDVRERLEAVRKRASQG